MKNRYKFEGAIAVVAAVLVLATLSGRGHADYVGGLNPSGDNFLSLRSGPGSKYQEIRRLGPNTFLSVETRRGSWLKVHLQDGGTGWVYAKYVAPGVPPAMPGYAPDPQTTAAGDFGFVSGLNPRGDNYLSLRAGPGSNYREIHRMGPGLEVDILGRRGDWYNVSLADGMRGWAFAKYISIDTGLQGAVPDSSMPQLPPAISIQSQQTAPPAIVSPTASGWTHYENPRFGTMIEFPADLFTPLPPPENSDGLSFQSANGAARFIIFGQFNALEKSVEEMMADDLASGLYEQVTYQRKGADWYVLSGYRQGNVFYRKVIVPAGTDMLHAFEIDYPPQQKAAFDTITARMAKSFSAPTAASIGAGPAKADDGVAVSPPQPEPMNEWSDSTTQPAEDELRSLLRAEFLALGENIQ